MTAEMFRCEAPCAIARRLMPACAEGLEQLAGDAVVVGHAVADDGDDRAAGVDRDALDLAVAQLRGERAANRALRERRLAGRDREADRVLGTALRDQDHRDPGLVQRAEQAVRRARDADHAGALEVDERDVADAGDALDLLARLRRGDDGGPGVGRGEGIPDADRDVLLDRGRHGLRVDDLRAEIGELHGLVVRERAR